MKSNEAFLEFVLPDEQATQTLAQQCAAFIDAPFVLTLSGEIGAGKTSFVRALLRALGVLSSIKSPTFSLVETYALPGYTEVSFYHFDLYRVVDVYELEYIGFRECFTQQNICCIEWPEHALQAIGPIDLKLSLSLAGNGRRANLLALSQRGKEMLERLNKKGT